MPDRWYLFDKQGDTLEIFISGEIDDKQSVCFLDELRDNLPAKEISLRLNSTGGDVYTGVAIYNRLSALSRDGVKIRARVEGIAASIASIIAMSADEITIPESSFMMVHEPIGDDERLVSIFKDTFVRAIANRTGRSRDEVATLLANGTWMSGREAVWEKLCDSVADPS